MLPSLFISHGSPMLAIAPEHYGPAWAAEAQAWPRPSAIVVVSAHWTTHEPAISAAEHPEMIYDFGGFPRALYKVQYPASGSVALAGRISGLLKRVDISHHIDPHRGFDHGVWVPLVHLYPEALIPVVSVSVQPRQSAASHIALGKALSALREENVLIIGSGSLTHNLYECRFDETRHDVADTYVKEFQSWVFEALAEGNEYALSHWLNAPSAERAHPSPEHFLPLLVAWGAGHTGSVPPKSERWLAGYAAYVLAMDSYRFS